MMIFLIFFCFACLAIGLAFLMSYELRNKGRTFVLSLLPQGRRQLNQVRQFAQTMNQAAAPEKLQSHWHLQQWWIVIAGFLFASILIFAFTRPISSTRIEAEYLKN